MEKWQRFKYLPVIPKGADGALVTSSRAHIDLSRRAAADGMVLLKNTDNILPIKKGARVALFGKASADYVKGGGGSGDVVVKYVLNLCDAMERKEAEGKLEAYAPLIEFYRANVAAQRAEGKKPGYTVEPAVPAELLERAASECDLAIISICRFSTEGRDRKGTVDDGDFYLSVQEKAMVKAVCTAFSDVVVVFNVGGMVDTAWCEREPAVKAVLMAWQGGMEGALAEADILCGDVNPSGKLADTFAASFDDYPSSEGFSDSLDYVYYTEDIFVGYRYFETVKGAAERVNYPFGFGLSYTTFDIKSLGVSEADGVISLRISVTNTGDVAGREVVQLYSGAPEGGIDTPRYELRSFAKTKLLGSGESQELHLSLHCDGLASYDESLAAYVLKKGTYTIYIGSSVRSLSAVYSFDTDACVVKQLANRCAPSKLPRRLKSDGSYETLTVSEYPPKADRSHLPPDPKEDVEHVVPNHFGVRVSRDRVSLESVARGEHTIDEFIEGLSDGELVTLAGGCPNRGPADTRGFGGLDSVGVPPVMTADGPAGLRFFANRGVKTTAWPVACLLACTWDEELVESVGAAAASEVEENNIGMWLTPAINIHRSPLCGRNFEYYSEDPLLAGKLAAAMVRGIQSNNVAACAKHFCCNNKEDGRLWGDSIVSERALREIYLKAFEIVVREGGVMAIMTAYNKLNGTYTSEKKELITDILKGEWGYKGLVLTDWGNYADHCDEVLAGNDLRMPHGSPARLLAAMAEGTLSRADVVPCVRRVLELILKLK
ncbi:MAG: glycoside hydrolase family 3 C-terminal domain-containing protein [Clostridia bacterium]|nr:glycoside hydrolase family 3 C-terminal domain-containing protein [Clostridia bacterium]